MMRWLIVCALSAMLLGCSSARFEQSVQESDVDATSSSQPRTVGAIEPSPALSADALRAKLSEGEQFLAAQQYQPSLNAFSQVIEQCERVFGAGYGGRVSAQAGSTRLVAPRHEGEQMYYSVKAAVDKQKLRFMPYTCSEALYLWAYAGIAEGRNSEAETYLVRAAAISPGNSAVLSALGYLYHVNGQWEQAMSAFLRADKAAETLSPDNVKRQELLRAKQGLGHSLVELGRLNEAATVFRQCLLIDPEDAYAQKELKYLQALQSQPEY